MAMIRLAVHAMATRFELVLRGDDPVHLRAAGEEAAAEIERLDSQLSVHKHDSEVSWINSHAASQAVRVEPTLFKLLQRAVELSRKTDGAFDISVGPLVFLWRSADGSSFPEVGRIEEARRICGFRHLILDESDRTVRYDAPEVSIDLGAVGKGYAIERAAACLRENAVTSALIHGGTSSIYGLGLPPEQSGWRVAIRGVDREEAPNIVELRDESLSVSAVHGRSFEVEGQSFGHVVDPRTGMPVQHTVLAAVTGPSPTECDALSTALLILGKEWLSELRRRFPDYRAYVASPGAEAQSQAAT